MSTLLLSLGREREREMGKRTGMVKVPNLGDLPALIGRMVQRRNLSYVLAIDHHRGRNKGDRPWVLRHRRKHGISFSPTFGN